jgi:hypothetical protein
LVASARVVLSADLLYGGFRRADAVMVEHEKSRQSTAYERGQDDDRNPPLLHPKIMPRREPPLI